MPTALTLPRISWGSPDAPRRALLVHGLGSNGALMWLFGTALADDGWHATAVDLRGHGTAPRSTDYTIAAYAADLRNTRPDDGGAWDLVVGHSLGAASAVVAAAEDPAWTRRLVLIDPVFVLTDRDRDEVTAGRAHAVAHSSIAEVRAEYPHWHDNDVELKSLAIAQASSWAVDQTSIQNSPWDIRAAAAALTVPAHAIGADVDAGSMFLEPTVGEVLANPLISLSRVAGAGHSLHRDAPEETIRQLRAAIH